MAAPRIFVSHIRDPFTNLAIENYLLKVIQAPSLLLYQNTPCVVMGRAQNPWLEMDVAFLNQHNIPILRRQSGGGTVVHDLGNLNFSFLSPKTLFQKEANIQMVADSLASLKLPITIAERCDLFLETKKISGSAFRETKDNCFHHGTLLINSDLVFLRRCLQVSGQRITTKAIPSRRSSVTNLSHHAPDLTVEIAERFLITEFAKQYRLQPEHILHFSKPQSDWEIQATIEQYQSLDWIYHHTLPFSAEIHINNHAITVAVEQGYITSITPSLEACAHLIGQPYHQTVTRQLK